MLGSPAVQPSRRWKDTTEEKFSKGEELFGLLVKVGHWSLWWEALFWGRLWWRSPSTDWEQTPSSIHFGKRCRNCAARDRQLQKGPSVDTATWVRSPCSVLQSLFLFDTSLELACKYASAYLLHIITCIQTFARCVQFVRVYLVRT